MKLAATQPPNLGMELAPAKQPSNLNIKKHWWSIQSCIWKCINETFEVDFEDFLNLKIKSV